MLNSNVALDLKEENGTPYWRTRGADTWNPFKSSNSYTSVFDFTRHTVYSDWTHLQDSTNFTISNEQLILQLEAETIKYVQYKNNIRTSDNPKIVIGGTLNFYHSSGSSGKYYSYGYLEISKDAGLTWEKILNCSRDIALNETNKTYSFNTIVYLDNYANSNCIFRIGIETTKYYKATLTFNTVILIN